MQCIYIYIYNLTALINILCGTERTLQATQSKPRFEVEATCIHISPAAAIRFNNLHSNKAHNINPGSVSYADDPHSYLHLISLTVVPNEYP